jgi:hypothetical protein
MKKIVILTDDEGFLYWFAKKLKKENPDLVFCTSTPENFLDGLIPPDEYDFGYMYGISPAELKQRFEPVKKKLEAEGKFLTGSMLVKHSLIDDQNIVYWGSDLMENIRWLLKKAKETTV